MALTGLTNTEILQISVSLGFVSHRSERPLSPDQVCSLVWRAVNHGCRVADCASEFGLIASGYLYRVMSLRKLVPELRSLVTWGHSKATTIGFSSAAELARVHAREDQMELASAILEKRMKSSEVNQVVQLSRRASRARSMRSCIEEVLGMRPVIEKRHVHICTISDENVQRALAGLTDDELAVLLARSLDDLGFDGVSGTLGVRMFRLTGDERLGDLVKAKGEDLQTLVRDAVASRLAA